MNSAAEKRLCAPLLDALQLMKQWVLRDGASRVIVATPTLSELKRQSLPDHISVSVKKRHGPRVAVHGPRQYRNAGLYLHNWPDDAQHSIVMPTLICVISGRADFHIADYFLQLQTGDLLIIPPGVPQPSGATSHIEDKDPDRHCDLLWMCPKMAGIDGMECWICHSQGEKHEIGRAQEVCWVKNPFLIHLFSELVEEAQHMKKNEILFDFLTSLLLMTQREIEQERVFLPGHQSTQDPGQSPNQANRDPIRHQSVRLKVL